ncbi:MAG: hypothetical protein ACTSQJ_09610, partial [Promethearchaeota archaeon]
MSFIGTILRISLARFISTAMYPELSLYSLMYPSSPVLSLTIPVNSNSKIALASSTEHFFLLII